MLQEMNDLAKALNTLKQGSLGWLVTGTSNIVSYKKPEDRERVQKELDELVGRLGIVFLFTLFETTFENGNNVNGKAYDASLWEKYMTEDGTKFLDDYEKFLAYRHIRHTVVHNSNNLRANTHDNEFDSVQLRTNSRDRIRNITYDATHIYISKPIVLDLLELMIIQVNRIQVYSSKYNL
jgi:hypothetical protein